MKHLLITLLAASALTAGATADQPIFSPSGNPVLWPTPHTVMNLSVDSFPFYGSQEAAIMDAIRRWNDVPGRFNFSISRGDKAVWINNGENEIWLTTQTYLLSGAPAICLPTYSYNGVYVEADVLFDAYDSWSFSENKNSFFCYGGGKTLPFRAVAVHELGHALGLGHEDNAYNVMGDAARHLSTNGSLARAYPGEDAGDGMITLYGAENPPKEDVGAVHWGWVSRSRGYSVHGRTGVFQTNGAPFPSSVVGGEPVFQVSAGDVVGVQCTFENNGSNSQVPLLDFVLSGNDDITTLDTLLLRAQVPLDRDQPLTATAQVRLPGTLNVGEQWFLGVIIDPTDRIAEWNESNNATYVEIQIVP